MRTLHLIDSLRLGGTEWQCLSLVRNLPRERFASHVVALHHASDLVAEVEGLAYTAVCFRGLRCIVGWRDLVNLARLMRRLRIHAVQTYGFYSNVAGIVAARLARVPIVIASRRDMGEALTPFNRRVERCVFRLASRVIANAEAIRRELVTSGQVREAKIIVIPTGVDVARFDGCASTEGPADWPEWTRSGTVVAMVAKFRRAKDHATVLAAAKRVRAVDPTVVWVFAGDGYLKKATERLAEEMEITSSVRFVGTIDPKTMPAFLRHVDISVLASKGFEGLPNVVLESMVAGKPVVATDCGGCREAVEDGVTGFLVPPGDSAQLADRVLRLIQDPSAAVRMGKAGRARVEAEFSLTKMVDRFSSLYTALAQEKLGWSNGSS